MSDHNQSRRLRRSVPIALLRAREAVMAHFRPLLAQRGYTEQQWRVLRALDEYGPIDATLLAEKSALLLPSLTRILQNLEEEGALTRKRDEKDRRRITVTLTDRSRAEIDAAADSTNKAYKEIEAQFGKENMDQLLELLSQLAKIKGPDTDR